MTCFIFSLEIHFWIVALSLSFGYRKLQENVDFGDQIWQKYEENKGERINLLFEFFKAESSIVVKIGILELILPPSSFTMCHAIVF